MGLSVRENLYLNPAVRGRRSFDAMAPAAERRLARHAIHRFGIRPPEPDKTVGTLSGGNQQKAVLARWLDAGVRLLVLEEPTMGVDVGAKSEIYALMNEALEAGLAMVVISAKMSTSGAMTVTAAEQNSRSFTNSMSSLGMRAP